MRTEFDKPRWNRIEFVAGTGQLHNDIMNILERK